MKTSGKILIVEDDNYVLLSIRILLEQHFTHVRGINNPDQLMTAVEENNFDVIILDMNFKPSHTSGEEGMAWLSVVKRCSPDTSIILLTAYGGIDMAVQAIKNGAFDFIIKPWENDKLVSSVSAGLQLATSQYKVKRLTTQNQLLSDSLNSNYKQMIGNSPAIISVKNTIEKVAATDANVLILGENGTGKELVARALHSSSLRKQEIFVNVDMGAITETLFESELFGHKKGAFTDAVADRIGRFEAASHGTIFLDEIGNLSLNAQAKLLKVLQEKTIVKVGSNEPVKVDARIISATNRNLFELIQKQKFREDLLYRLNTVEIVLPPLRSRVGDIPQLAQFFLDRYKMKYNKRGLYVPEYVIKKLMKYPWPGNIRELEHAIERSVIMSDGKQLHVRDFAFGVNVSREKEQNPASFNLEGLEKWAIEQALQKHLGNISQAASELGLSRGALYRRMEKYEI